MPPEILHLHIVIQKVDNSQEELKLYKNGCGKVNLYPFYSPMLYKILKDKTFPYKPINMKELPEELAHEIREKQTLIGYYDYHEITMQDLDTYTSLYASYLDKFFTKNLLARIEEIIDITYPLERDDIKSVRLIYYFEEGSGNHIGAVR